MASGKHSRGKHSVPKGAKAGGRKSRAEFSFPKGPASAEAPDEVEVPAEIAKTAAGKMQTAEHGRDEHPQGQAATGESLDEWVKEQTSALQQQQVSRLERRGKLLIAAIVVLALVIVGAIFLAASYRPTSTPSQVGSAALEALKERDFDSFGELYAGDAGALESELEDAFTSGAGLGSKAEVEKDLNDEQKKTLAQLEEKLADFDYTIGSEGVEGDSASVQVTISAYDFGTFAQNVLGSYIADGLAATSEGDLESDADAATRFVRVLEEHEGELSQKTRSVQTTLLLQRSDDGAWKLSELSQDNLDALTGGLLATTGEMARQLASGTEG